MSTTIQDRTIRPNGNKIKKMRVQQNWRLEDLAEKAECSIKTITSVEASKNVYRFTLNRIATAFGVEAYTLFYYWRDRRNRTYQSAPPSGYTVVIIKTNIKLEDIDESTDVIDFFKELADHIRATNPVEPTLTMPGCTEFVVRLHENDALRLLCEFQADQLHALPFQIVSVRIDKTSYYVKPTFQQLWEHTEAPKAGTDVPPKASDEQRKSG